MTQATTLAAFLRAARERRALTLRAVEEATGISNAYLSQLEHGRIREPSPVMLHKLSELYGVDYSEMMQLAGYPVPQAGRGRAAARTEGPLGRLGTLSPDEERELAEYLEFLRSRRRSGSP